MELALIRRLLIATAICLLPSPGFAADHWVGTWGASPLAVANNNKLFATDSTLREIAHVSLGGRAVRLLFSNEFGTEPLHLGAVTIAPDAGGGALPGSAPIQVTFGGHAETVIPSGAMVLSDTVSFSLAPLSNVAVSIFVPAQNLRTLTTHPLAMQTSYLASGNQVNQRTLTAATETTVWHFLKGIQISAAANAASIVTLGDSITDGARSSRGTNSRWPDILAKRLQANKGTAQLSIVNEGISGNRLLHDVAGPSALARFDRDVLAQPNVRFLVVLEGINDIGRTAQPRELDDPIQTPQLIEALRQIIERAHSHGIKVYGATLTPYGGAAYSSPDGEAMRSAENAFIRSGVFDGVIDFDKMTRDPSKPATFQAAYDSDDHLHPNDAGYKAMGEGIDLKLFEDGHPSHY
jgi:lysophospholipase L1-like esterase